MNRCISAVRLPASCTGQCAAGRLQQDDYLDTAFRDRLEEAARGAGNGRRFCGHGELAARLCGGGVLVNCSFLSPNEETYCVKFKANRTALIINNTPKPLNLTFHAVGT